MIAKLTFMLLLGIFLGGCCQKVSRRDPVPAATSDIQKKLEKLKKYSDRQEKGIDYWMDFAKVSGEASRNLRWQLSLACKEGKWEEEQWYCQ